MIGNFVSLNVHDSLTFEGCEICLNPEVFPFEPGDAIEIRIWEKEDTLPLQPPPPAIRSRTSTLDRGGKPPMASRRSVSSVTTPKAKSHTRDVSDMTLETIEHTNTNQHILSSYSEDTEDNHNLRLSFVIILQNKSLEHLKNARNTQVSLLRNIAELYNLSSYDFCTIHKITPHEWPHVLDSVSADFVLVTIKDQFVSRGDMHRFQSLLLNSWIYQGQRLYMGGMQAHAREIRHSDRQARSGIVTKDTKITVRSRSARFVWLVQMSAEMWDYSSPWEEGLCQIYFDKFVQFVHELFEKWKTIEATHSLTVVFFSRTFGTDGNTKDVYGRSYEDHFRIVIENETRADWESLVVKLKEAFLRYPIEVGWNLETGEKARRPSSASQGNVLEAINVALNIMQYHYFDRDLHRTGNSILVVSAGSGVFEVDKGLSSITYQRMMDNGIGSDMLSLSLPPLHIAPFFLYVNDYQNIGTADASESYYEVPHWMHLSFVSYESNTGIVEETDNSQKQRSSAIDLLTEPELEIGSNGFIMPSNFRKLRVEAPQQRLSPTRVKGNFSAHGNAAATPPQFKTFEKGRHLIADRDFEDILEACRPRFSGVMPSALKTIIESNQATKDITESVTATKENPTALYSSKARPKGENIETQTDTPKDVLSESPKEWGALELSSKPETPKSPGRLVIGPRSPADNLSPLLAPMMAVSPPKIDQLDQTKDLLASSLGSDPGSKLSSSRHSTSILGVSYDRVFLNQLSPLQLGLQLQRPPSLDLEEEEDLGGLLSDDSVSSAGLIADGSSDEGYQSRTKREKIIEKALKSMQFFDESVLQHDLTSLKLDTGRPRSRNAVDSSKHSTITSDRVQADLLSRREESQTSLTGGVGPAIAKYRSTSGGSSNIHRVSSSSGMPMSGPNMFAGLSQSPLLLPPVILSTTAESNEGLMLPSIGKRTLNESRRLQSKDFFASLTRRDSTGGILRAGGTLNPSSRQFFSEKFGGTAHTMGRNISSQALVSTSPPTQSGLASLFAPPSPKSLAVQPPQEDNRLQQRHKGGELRSYGNSKRKKAFNPFREEDENEVLAKKSHNRRRWSHVFPAGEIEFKRHAGPNWKSLSSPAILPLSIDYFPPQSEIDHSYTFSINNVTIADFENPRFSTNKDFLFQMVAQRLTQDYQLVPPSHVNASNYKRESLRDGLAHRKRSESVQSEDDDSIRVFMSMGHSLQVLTYDANADTVEVTRYNAIDVQRNAKENTHKYFYRAWCDETKSFKCMSQEFHKYSELYNWNKVDRILGGDEDRELRDGMRFRRLMFAVLPESTKSLDEEKAYVAKFERLLEYFNKLKEKSASQDELEIKIVTSENRDLKEDEHQSGTTISVPGLARNSMKKFYVDLRKGKGSSVSNYGWFEVSLDATFDTTWTYRIMYSWLVAGSGQMDPQLQLLQRRCTQYGLTLVPVPQVSVSRNIFINSFKAPTIYPVTDVEKASKVDGLILGLDFIHDGVFYTDALNAMECVAEGGIFDFGKRWTMPPAGRQYLHRSGLLFARVLNDRKSRAVIMIFGNNRLITRDSASLRPKADQIFQDLTRALDTLLDT